MLCGTKSLLMNLKSRKKMGKVTIIAKYDDGEEIKADRDYLMIMPHNDDNLKIGNEWFYLGKFL